MNAALPTNIVEFNEITGLVFAQLYKTFPITLKELDLPAIAKAMGVETQDQLLESGRPFNEVASFTLAWLITQGFIQTPPNDPTRKMNLTAKGVAALNTVPSGKNSSIGKEIIEAADKEPSRRDLSQIGDLIGGIIGGAYKSIMGA